MGASEAPTRLKLSIDQYYRMAEAGMLAPQARVESIDGAIYEMAPLGSLHAALVDQLHRVLLLRLHPRAIVVCRGPTVDGCTSAVRVDRQGRVDTLAFPDEQFDVAALLPE